MSYFSFKREYTSYFLVVTRSISIMLLIVLCSCSNNISLVKHKISDYVIFVSEDAIASEKTAARILQENILKIADCKIPITYSKSTSEKVIYLGFKEAPSELLKELDTTSFEKGEYVIRTNKNQLFIAGGKPRGTLYGVIGFLSNQLGCRWYTPGFAKIPKQEDVVIKDLDIREKPVFEYREAWFNEAYQPVWAAYNRLNPNLVSMPDSLGGGYKMYPFVHTFYQLIPPEKYMKTHPEYYSMVDGKRILDGHSGQLCLTNPDVIRIATEQVFKWIEENPDVDIFSVDQNDNNQYCQCPSCAALDEVEESQAGCMIHFVNQIADSVAKRYPHVKLQTLAYNYSIRPPKNLKPRKNVTIRMCPLSKCNTHAIDDSTCERNVEITEAMSEWAKIADRITIWDYFTNFRHYFIPFPNFETVTRNVRYYADRNCIGLFAQGNNVPDNGGAEFSALRAWVFAQLMWNPYQDGWALINEFVENVYGEAAPFIKEYISLIQNKILQSDVHLGAYDFEPTQFSYLPPDLIVKAENLFVKAENAAKSDSLLLERIELAHLPVLYTRLYLYSAGAKGYLKSDEVTPTLDKFKRIIEKNKITRLAEREDLGNLDNFISRVENKGDFITDWWVVGPFNNENRKGFDKAYSPEISPFDSTQVFIGDNNQQLKWLRYNNTNNGYMDLGRILHINPKKGVAYAYTTIKSSDDKNYKIGIGSNDGVKVWIIGELQHRNKANRKAEINQEVLTIPLKKGENTVLVKIDKTSNGWGFYFSILELG